MDLSNYTSDRASIPVEVTIKHPSTGLDTDNIIMIVGVDSTAAQKCMDEQQARRFNEMAEAGEVAKFNPATSREDLIQLLVACTTGWKNVMWKGALLDFTPANVKMIYESVPTIRDQINRATGSRKLFFKD